MLTTATDVTLWMPSFLESCYRNGMNPVVIGLQSKWPGNGMKIRLIHEFLQRQRRDGLVLFSDAYDSFVTQDAETIVGKFRSYGCRLLFSAERTCWPFGALAGLYPPSPTPYQYLNAGGWIGEAGYLLDLMERWGATRVPPDQASEQAWWTSNYVEDTEVLALDVHCRIFQTLYAAQDDLEEREGGVYNRVCHSYPAIIHGNGRQALQPYLEWSGVPEKPTARSRAVRDAVLDSAGM